MCYIFVMAYMSDLPIYRREKGERGRDSIRERKRVRGRQVCMREK